MQPYHRTSVSTLVGISKDKKHYLVYIECPLRVTQRRSLIAKCHGCMIGVKLVRAWMLSGKLIWEIPVELPECNKNA